MTSVPPLFLEAPAVPFHAVTLRHAADDRELRVTERLVPNDEPFGEDPHVVLSRVIEAVRFEYRDEEGTWQDRWERNRNALPVTIKVELTVRDPGRWRADRGLHGPRAHGQGGPVTAARRRRAWRRARHCPARPGAAPDGRRRVRPCDAPGGPHNPEFRRQRRRRPPGRRPATSAPSPRSCSPRRRRAETRRPVYVDKTTGLLVLQRSATGVVALPRPARSSPWAPDGSRTGSPTSVDGSTPAGSRELSQPARACWTCHARSVTSSTTRSRTGSTATRTTA